jgi:hypothetical protein
MSEPVNGQPPVLKAPPEEFGTPVEWDKPAPSAPPGGQLTRNLPTELVPIEAWLQSLAADEGLLLDICLQRAMSIVEYNYSAGAVGIDQMNDSWNRASILQVAVPLALKLYDACDKALPERRTEPGGLDELIQKLKDGRSRIIKPA